jgi:hypothetical protein
VYASLPAPAGLKAGAFVEGRVLTGVAEGMVVPAAAVVVRDGFPYVFTVDGERRARRVQVRTGERLGAEVEIVSGLAADARVVVDGAGFLGDGDRVRVVDAPR